MDRERPRERVAEARLGAGGAKVPYPIRIRCLEVVGRQTISPTMLRLTLGGQDLVGFESHSVVDEHVKIVFPDPDGGLRVPEPNGSMVRWPHPMPPTRDYTVRRYDPTAGELDLDVVLHAGGLASEWAARVGPGEPVWVAGPPAGPGRAGALRPLPARRRHHRAARDRALGRGHAVGRPRLGVRRGRGRRRGDRPRRSRGRHRHLAAPRRRRGRAERRPGPRGPRGRHPRRGVGVRVGRRRGRVDQAVAALGARRAPPPARGLLHHRLLEGGPRDVRRGPQPRRRGGPRARPRTCTGTTTTRPPRSSGRPRVGEGVGDDRPDHRPPAGRHHRRVVALDGVGDEAVGADEVPPGVGQTLGVGAVRPPPRTASADRRRPGRGSSSGWPRSAPPRTAPPRAAPARPRRRPAAARRAAPAPRRPRTAPARRPARRPAAPSRSSRRRRPPRPPRRAGPRGRAPRCRRTSTRAGGTGPSARSRGSSPGSSRRARRSSSRAPGDPSSTGSCSPITGRSAGARAPAR